MRTIWVGAVSCVVLISSITEARVVRLNVARRELILSGKPFGLGGPYEKLIGTVELALDPDLDQNSIIVDLALAPRDEHGEVRYSADFYLLKPVDPRRGNGVLFYEAGNRGRKRILSTFQKASPTADPTTEREIGDGALMRQGFSSLWMGWQWDVPQGRMRMEMPIATENGQPIEGLVRGNFILGERSDTALLADRGHRAYPVVDPEDDEHFMTVRRHPLTPVRRDFGPRWSDGIVSYEPPHLGEPFRVLVPAVDAIGNDRAGIRLPEIAVPLATHTGWNYRDPRIGAPDRLSSEIGAHFALPVTPKERLATGDSRPSVEELYRDKNDYIGQLTRAALELVEKRFLLVSDLPEIIEHAALHYDWASAQ